MKRRTKIRKWVTIDGRNGDTTLRQHCFVPVVVSEKVTDELYIGNESLCGNVQIGNENAEIERWAQTPMAEALNGEKCCRQCTAAFHKQF